MIACAACLTSAGTSGRWPASCGAIHLPSSSIMLLALTRNISRASWYSCKSSVTCSISANASPSLGATTATLSVLIGSSCGWRLRGPALTRRTLPRHFASLVCPARRESRLSVPRGGPFARRRPTCLCATDSTPRSGRPGRPTALAPAAPSTVVMDVPIGSRPSSPTPRKRSTRSGRPRRATNSSQRAVLAASLPPKLREALGFREGSTSWRH
jgi:hypothetical protein